MIKNYLKIAWRNLVKNKVHSFINIVGLSVGMAVAMLIGLWIYDELSFNKSFKNYDSIAQVMQKKTFNGVASAGVATSLPVEMELRKTYGSNFKNIAVAFWTSDHILTIGDKKTSFSGTFVTAELPEIFTLNMISGSRNGLKGPSSILISQTVAKALFGDKEPVGKIIKFDNDASLMVSGVYQDLAASTTLHELAFMAPWDYFLTKQDWLKRAATDWGEDSFQIYVQLADHVNMSHLSNEIKNIKLKNGGPVEAKMKPEVFLQPISKWHLYSEFKNGVNTGGAIEYVWLFGITGVFVLLLACINFMNLSTARSEKRAKEVGIRKAVGSVRGQLVAQFFFESLLIAVMAFVLSLLLVQLALPLFDDLAGKTISIFWNKPLFWLMGLGFTLFTGVIAGSYPALYLSSFNPVKVLKGTFKTGPMAAIPRKVLVVIQFTVSIVLIIGTIVVFNQIQFAKNRPVGYTRQGLINISTTNHDLDNQFAAIKADLLKSGAVTEVAQSSSPTTAIHNNRSDLTWNGKDPSMAVDFANVRVSTEFGKTVGWQFKDGRDFSSAFLTDSAGVVLNETAVKYMGLKNPVGQIIRFGRQFGNQNKAYKIIGVIKDMVMGSPYEPVKQTIFYLSNDDFDSIIIKINPKQSVHEAISKIEAVCKIYSPSVPFSFQFVDDEYAKKFVDEERLGKLATCFAVLAIMISCLGLFGMASFMAEQRIKEIGVRKVLGATVLNLWSLLSKDFVVLVIMALLIATPSSYYFMHRWLENYQYHTEIAWWIFAITALGALLITLATVSYQSIKAALMNPVKSLKTE